MPLLHVPPAEMDTLPGSHRNRVFSAPLFSTTLCQALLAAVILSPQLHAGLIHWGSRGYIENADSKGRNWDASYTMGIGVFRSGFNPTYENREQWAAAWTGIGTAVYDTEEMRFAGTVDTNSRADIPLGAKIYFWAKNGDDLTKGPEWVLITQESWTWPAKGTAITPAVVWTTGEQSISLVIGEAGKNGKHLISRALRPVPVPESTWLAQHFGNDTAAMAADADPDGDGLPNALEYFLGTDPNDASSKGGPELRADANEVRLRLARNPYAESVPILEASDDLKTWSRVDHELLTDRPDLLETSVPKDAAKPRLFYRFQLQPANR